MRTTLHSMSPLQPAAVPESVPLGSSFFIGARRFSACINREGRRVWVGRDRRFGDVILLVTDDRRYAVAPWLEKSAPRAMRELIRSGMIVPPDPLTLLHEPTCMDDADDAALRVAVLEALVETSQLSPDDAWSSLRAWRALRDGAVRP